MACPFGIAKVDDRAFGRTAALLRAQAARWVYTDGYPHVIEVEFDDIEGSRHALIDKTPLFDFEQGEPELDAVLPTPVLLDCVYAEFAGASDLMRHGA